LLARGVGEAEDLPRDRVVPVLEVAHAVLGLHRQVLAVTLCDVLRGDAEDAIVDVEEEGHSNLPPGGAGYAARRRRHHHTPPDTETRVGHPSRCPHWDRTRSPRGIAIRSLRRPAPIRRPILVRDGRTGLGETAMAEPRRHPQARVPGGDADPTW